MFVKFLKMFYDVTLKFSRSLHVTSNIFFKELVAMQITLQKIANRGDKVIVFYACRMMENFAKYWENFSNVNYLLHVAIVLDPRYKMKYVKFCFEQVYEASEAVIKIALVESTFNRLYEWYYDFYSSELGNEMNTPTRLEGIDDNDSDDIDDALENKLEEEAYLETKSEIGKYLLDNLEKLGSSDILDWWKLNASNYLILSKIARDILAIPISTVASESAFSISGRILDAFRSSLSPKTVEAFVCSQNWLKKDHTINLQEILEEVEKYEDITQGIIHKSFGLVIYIFVIYKMTILLFSMFC